MDYKMRIIHYTYLSEIFSRAELHKAIDNVEFTEKILNPGTQLITKGEKYNNILFVINGTLIEKDGDYDDFTHQLKFKRGNLGALQNLIPGGVFQEQISDIYCHNSTMARIIEIDTSFLRSILEKEPEKL